MLKDTPWGSTSPARLSSTDSTRGQSYWPSSSLSWRCSGKVVFSYGLVLVFLIACIRISRVHLKVILRGLKPLLIIIVLTGLLNLFYTQGTVLVHFWIFTITKEGLIMRAL